MALLKKNNLTVQNLDAIAISSGPGSYTGLRIGASSAKGFCFGLDIPLISVNTLEALCHMTDVSEGVKIPLIDARRMEVFGSVFNYENAQLNKDFNLVIDSSSFSDIEGIKYLFGNGAKKLKEELKDNKTVNFIDNIECSARGMVTLSEEKFQEKIFEDVAYFEPNYGKEFYTVPSKKG